MLKPKRYLLLFSLWVVQGGVAFVWLLLIPTDSGFYSIPRIALGGVILLFALISLFFVNKSRVENWPDFSHSDGMYNFTYILALIAISLPPVIIIILRVLGQTGNFTFVAYSERFTPLAFLSILSGLEWFIWHVFGGRADFSDFKYILKPFFYILLSFSVVAGIIWFTGWGRTATGNGSFGGPPTPLLEWQIILAILLVTVFMLTESNWQGKRLNAILFLLVYLFACLLWLTDPLVPGFFATPPRAPNFEPYPFSDALIYSQYAQSALVGNGFLWPEVPTRPLYITLLTWMHALVGQNYYHIIILQTLLLAFFPAMLYLLGSELGSRSLGLMLALLATLRDMTANHAASFALNYSYSKLFFSEIPTALLLAIFTLLVIRWLKATKPYWYLLIMGCILGAAALIRLQSAVLLTPLALLAACVMWKTRRVELIGGLVLMVMGVMLMLVPWLTRNYFAADGFVLDNPISQSMVFASRWNGDNGNTIIPRLPDETTAQYTSRMTVIALDNFKREPGRILSGAANHFFNNLISSLYILPMRDRLKSPGELIWPEHAFWQTGVRRPIFSAFSTILLALGLATAWQSNRWIGLLPFGFSIGYNAWTALFLSSGDRFLIPIDWSWYLYDCLGIIVILRLLLSGLRNTTWISGRPKEEHKPEGKSLFSFSWQQIFLTSIFILFVGSLVPLTEVVFSKKYPPQTREQLSAVLNIPIQETDSISYGRAIYPRYYDAGKGEPGSAKLGYGKSSEARLVFWMAGPEPRLVIFPLESAPNFFPNASDVWVVGNEDGNVLYARIIKIENDRKSSIYYAP